jgi:long-chain acyl-CoA synthetase
VGGGRRTVVIDPLATRGGDTHDAIVTSDGRATTYGELSARVADGAARLTAAGLTAGHAVVVSARAPAAFCEAALAAWRAGLVVVPADPRAPEAAVSSLSARAGAAAVLTGGEAGDDVSIALHVKDCRAHDPDLALLLSTSGSSAAPKLVALATEGVLANVHAILSYLPVADAPRTAVLLPLSYSYGLVGQVLTTLFTGGTLLLLGDVPFASKQVERMRALSADGLSTVPTQLRSIMRALEEDGDTLALTYVANAGAAWDAETRTRAKACFPRATFFNQYGLTEASPRVTALSDAEEPFARGSVGRPIAGMSVRAVDEGGSAVPPGTLGELEVRGPSVMRGYLDDDAATARALTGGWLRTGDAGHVDEAGYVWVAGRRDGVVKCAGERVSVEEIAATLRAAGVEAELAVVAIDHDELGAELWAFVEGPEAVVKDLRRAAVATLSPPKRPAHVVALPALPRTANGKLASGELRAEAMRRRAARTR